MSRLAAFLSALWLTTTTAHPGFFAEVSNTATGIKNGVVNEVQTVLNPVGQTIAFIGGKLCGGVKPIAGVAYENYDKEPDMSKLTLVFQNRNKTVIYNLVAAPTEFPLEQWFDPQSPLLIFFHGFTDNPQKGSFQTMKQAVQEAQGNANILALDASSLIAFFYLRASTMVRFIGELVGATLAALYSATGMDPSKIHLIGHSLGSHIAGFAGKQFYNNTGLKVGRISGLDPAGPCFGDLDPTLRLQSADAQFVDVIHSDAGVYGLNEKVGHVDFYPNSGAEQPNCLFQTCSHSRAWELFAESVGDADAFMSVQCNSYDDFRHDGCHRNDTSVMGYHTPTDTRGSYFLMTRGESPYGAGELGTTFQVNGILRLLMNRFPWAKITKICYNKRLFTLRLRAGEFDEFETVLSFKLCATSACKKLWRCSVEHHMFFRRESPVPVSRIPGWSRLGSRRLSCRRTLRQLRAAADRAPSAA